MGFSLRTGLEELVEKVAALSAGGAARFDAAIRRPSATPAPHAATFDASMGRINAQRTAPAASTAAPAAMPTPAGLSAATPSPFDAWNASKQPGRDAFFARQQAAAQPSQPSQPSLMDRLKNSPEPQRGNIPQPGHGPIPISATQARAGAAPQSAPAASVGSAAAAAAAPPKPQAAASAPTPAPPAAAPVAPAAPAAPTPAARNEAATAQRAKQTAQQASDPLMHEVNQAGEANFRANPHPSGMGTAAAEHAAPSKPAAPPQRAPAPQQGGMFRGWRGPAAAVGLGAAGALGYGAWRQHQEDKKRDNLIYSPMSGMG